MEINRAGSVRGQACGGTVPQGFPPCAFDGFARQPLLGRFCGAVASVEVTGTHQSETLGSHC